jgi:hypothetical protein
MKLFIDRGPTGISTYFIDPAHLDYYHSLHHCFFQFQLAKFPAEVDAAVYWYYPRASLKLPKNSATFKIDKKA